MINVVHVVLYTAGPKADRAFLNFSSVNAGHGRLIDGVLRCFSFAAREYLPRPEYQAEGHQRDFRKHI
jgi:hypothetical protein